MSYLMSTLLWEMKRWRWVSSCVDLMILRAVERHHPKTEGYRNAAFTESRAHNYVDRSFRWNRCIRIISLMEHIRRTFFLSDDQEEAAARRGRNKKSEVWTGIFCTGMLATLDDAYQGKQLQDPMIRDAD
jgi:hypothetical protein